MDRRFKARAGVLAALLAALCLVALPLAAGAQPGGSGNPAPATASGEDDAPPAKRAKRPSAADFEKVTLNDDPGEPMGLAVLPDGRVLHTARTGEVRIHDPNTGDNELAATIDVYQHDEEGLQSVAIDPQFRTNNWVYLYYSPPLNTPEDDPTTQGENEGDAPDRGSAKTFRSWRGHINLSRFKLEGNRLNLATEQVILRVGVDRGLCCHVGGDIDFDGSGNLLLTTGDDTNPFESQGYAPLDERPKRNPGYDAQRSSANTNDLRGKLLRIRVREDGSYAIPRGNMFPESRDKRNKTRPEIFAMGLRNPFRMSVDRRTNTVYVGDYSPDADEPDPERGPAGHGEWIAIRRPGNYGWPYCGGENLPYNRYDFAEKEGGKPFNCRRLYNRSPHNTGLVRLPRALEPQISYSYKQDKDNTRLEKGGIGPMGGPVYQYNRAVENPDKFPLYYDDKAFFYEWTRDYVKAFTLRGSNNRVVRIESFLPSVKFDNPMDMEFGPNGELYVLEYGDGFFTENPEAQLSRIAYSRGLHTPRARAKGTPTSSGQAPLTVQFSSEGTVDKDKGEALTYEWDFQGDGTIDSTEPNPSFTYTANGTYRSRLRVTDPTGRRSGDVVVVTVGNTPPTVVLERPTAKTAFKFGDKVKFKVTVTDAEGTAVDCKRVKVTYLLGHNEHAHPLSSTGGCEGSIQTSEDTGHDPDANIYGVIVATYEDEGANGQAALEGRAEVVLRPKKK